MIQNVKYSSILPEGRRKRERKKKREKLRRTQKRRDGGEGEREGGKNG